MFIMKILAVSFTLCAILTITQAGPINSTTSWDGGLCAYKRRYCSNLAGSFCPQCDANGNFLPQQCSGSTGYCWCVNTMTGNEIPNTKTPPGVMPVNCMKKDSYCPDGWFQFGQRCFSFISSPKTWTEAQIYCQFDGGNLASIHSYEENQFLQTLTRGNTHDFPETWIGGTDAIHPGLWMWIDGSKFYYENWCNNNDHDYNYDTDDHNNYYDTNDHDHHYDSSSHERDNTSDHDSHDDTDDHDHDNTRHHDSHDDTDDHDHDNTSDHDSHDDTDDHDHDNTRHHDSHDDTDDHDHDNTSNHDNHDDTDDHDHNNTRHHDNHDDTDDHDHDHDHNNTSHHDSHDDTDDHDDHYDNHDHHKHNKRTSSCLRMNCHYKMKWCTAACNDAFPFVCSKTI